MKHYPLSLYYVEASPHFQKLFSRSIVAALLLATSSNNVCTQTYSTPRHLCYIKFPPWVDQYDNE